jgi:hypothetical protein
MEIKDHLWLLQTDPAYFYEVAAYCQMYNLSTISGAKSIKDAKLHNLGGRIIVYTITQLQDWDFISEELRNVRRQSETHREGIKPGRHLPEAYDQALGRLEYVVINRLIHKSMHLKEQMFTSPTWRSMWKVDEHLGDGKITASFDPSGMNHLFGCLMALGAIGERPKTAG